MASEYINKTPANFLFRHVDYKRFTLFILSHKTPVRMTLEHLHRRNKSIVNGGFDMFMANENYVCL